MCCLICEVTSHYQLTNTASTFTGLSTFDTASFSVPILSWPCVTEPITLFAISMADGLEQGQRQVPSLRENDDFQLSLLLSLRIAVDY